MNIEKKELEFLYNSLRFEMEKHIRKQTEKALKEIKDKEVIVWQQ